MKLLVTFALLLPVANGWVYVSHQRQNTCMRAAMPGEMDSSFSSEMDPENPCWQDIYDDDCSLTSAYSASFIASKWIKSMPCAKGIDDCDMPENLQLPATHKQAGVENVDVMSILGLKRAKSLGKGSNPKPKV